jgi:hypothetical protein
MDTVNRYVTAASTALWGENQESQDVAHGDEPVSGVQGKGVVNDPYDAGNRDGKCIVCQLSITRSKTGINPM